MRFLKLILKLLQHVSVPLDHHQGARLSYPKVTTDHLLVRFLKLILKLLQHVSVPLDHHQGARRS